MPLRFSQRSIEEVPPPQTEARAYQELQQLKAEMFHLAPGMVLEIEAAERRQVRAIKLLVSRAARELGATWQHWNLGNSVYARPVTVQPRRRRRRQEQPII